MAWDKTVSCPAVPTKIYMEVLGMLVILPALTVMQIWDLPAQQWSGLDARIGSSCNNKGYSCFL